MPFISNPERHFQRYFERYSEQAKLASDFATELGAVTHQVVIDAAKVISGDIVLVRYEDPATPLVMGIYQKCRDLGAQIDLYRKNPQFEKDEVLRKRAIQAIFTEQKERADLATKVIFVNAPADPNLFKEVPLENNTMYNNSFVDAYGKQFREGAWTNIDWFTPAEAMMEGLTYEKYLTRGLKACSQDWHQIHDTQAILKDMLDQTEKLQIVVDHPDPKKSTNLTTSIKGFTCFNSTIGRNYPGAEVGTSPELYSANGQFYTPGRFRFKGELMQGIQLLFENGRVIGESAEVGIEVLRQILNLHERMRYLGEMAFGGNRGIDIDMLLTSNRSILEKAAATIHIALGFCIADPMYQTLKGPQPLNANNGNLRVEGVEHVDLTTPTRGKDLRSKILADDRVIQRDGIYLDERLAILNPTV